MNNLEFGYPINLSFIIIPVLVLCILILGNRKKKRIMSGLNMEYRDRFKIIRSVFMVTGLLLIVLACMRPQILNGVTEVEGKGLDIYVLLDTSKSMLAEDIKPSRIERAINITQKILDKLHGDRIGFIPFSSSAYVQMPLTDDYTMARMFLNVVDTDMISGGGSNVGNAFLIASQSFEETYSGNKVIIILSDGEDHNTETVETIKTLDDKDIKVFTVGIGTEKGGLIPIYNVANGLKQGYKKDKDGETIITKLHEESLMDIAHAGGGVYYRSSGKGEEIDSLLEQISKLQKTTYKSKKVKDFKQIYQYFLLIGLLLFMIAYILPERRKSI